MAIFADVVEEWKKASGKEKLLIVGGGAAVIALALYLHSKSSSSTLAGTGTTGVGGSFQPATGGTGSTGATGSPPPNDGGTIGFPLPPPGLIGPPVQKPGAGKWITVGNEVPTGTTLQQIANQFGLSLQQLLALNPWAQPYNPTLPGNINGQVVQVAASTPAPAAPSLTQPNTTTRIYAQTKHGPSIAPVVTRQSAPPQTRPR